MCSYLYSLCPLCNCLSYCQRQVTELNEFFDPEKFSYLCCSDLKLVSCNAAVVLNKIHAPVVEMLNSLMGNLLPLEFCFQAAVVRYLTLQQMSLICQNGK